MKKIFAILLSISLCFMTLSGCRCEHVWQEATCETAKLCINCGAVEQPAKGHSWLQATCEQPQTCEVCQKTEGNALGHIVDEQPTCVSAARCSRCNTAIKEALGHQWQDATRSDPKTCTVCNATEGQPLTILDIFPEGQVRHDGNTFLMTPDDFIELYDELYNRGSMFDWPATIPELGPKKDENTKSYRIWDYKTPGQIIHLKYDPDTIRITRIVIELNHEAIYSEEATANYLLNAVMVYLVANSMTTPQSLMDNMEQSAQISNGGVVSSGCLNGVSYRLETRYHYMTMEIWVETNS